MARRSQPCPCSQKVIRFYFSSWALVTSRVSLFPRGHLSLHRQLGSFFLLICGPRCYSSLSRVLLTFWSTDQRYLLSSGGQSHWEANWWLQVIFFPWLPGHHHIHIHGGRKALLFFRFGRSLQLFSLLDFGSLLRMFILIPGVLIYAHGISCKFFRTQQGWESGPETSTNHGIIAVFHVHVGTFLCFPTLPTLLLREEFANILGGLAFLFWFLGLPPGVFSRRAACVRGAGNGQISEGHSLSLYSPRAKGPQKWSSCEGSIRAQMEICNSIVPGLTWIWTVSELDPASGGQDKERELRQERGLSVQAPKTCISFQNMSVLLFLFIFSLLAKIVLIPTLAYDTHPTSRWRNLK